MASAKTPSLPARAAFWWLSAEKASCSSRVRSYRLFAFSVSSPMATWSKVSDSPSWAIESSSVVLPYFVPVREPASRCGAWVIDSWPPATTMSNSPARISWSAMAMALRPERQTLLRVSAGTVIGMPAATAAGRAGF